MKFTKMHGIGNDYVYDKETQSPEIKGIGQKSYVGYLCDDIWYVA